MYLERVPTVIRYLGGFSAAVFAITLQNRLQSTLKISGVGFLYPMAFLCAWRWGLGPAIVAILVGATGVFLINYEPTFSIVARDTETYARLTTFVVSSLFVAVLIRRGRSSERRFLETANHLRLITDRLPSFVSYIDRAGRYQFVNRAYEEWFGVKAAKIRGKTRAEFAPRITSDLAAPFERRALDGETVRYENIVTSPSGATKQLEVEILPDRDPRSGEIRGAVIFGHDVTERKEALKRAELSRKGIQDLFQQAPVGIAVFEGPSHVCSLANPTFLAILFTEPRSLIGRSIREAFPESVEQGYVTMMDDAFLNGNESVGTEAPIRIRSANDVERTVYLNYVYQPRRDPEGKIDGVLVVLYDVTEQALAKQRIEQAVRVRDEFLSIASHELRTPVTGMKLQTQMMKRALNKGDQTVFAPARVTKLVDQMDHGLERINRLVSDMLDISRIQNGKLQLDREHADLATMVRETLDRFSGQLSAVRITAELSGLEAVPAEFDRFRMEQVFTNLVTNAIRYAPGAPLQIKLSTSGPMARIVFHDSGPGIAPENHAKIFERFERLVSADEISGLGIGLYIVREIIQAHGGSIRVDDTVKKGACFVIEFPMLVSAPSEASL